jgi:branched-subunit amino acid transport protein AzlD
VAAVTAIAVAVTCVGCYALKAAGFLVPERVITHPRTAAAVRVLPLALLASLIVTQTFQTRTGFALDGRALGVVVAAVALRLHAPLALALVLAVAAAAVLYAFTRI